MIIGGCGVVTLPFNLIGAFINRPKPISITAYATAKRNINRWAEDLKSTGKSLKKKILEKGRNHPKLRPKLIKYEKQVNDLEKTYSDVEVAYKLRGGNPIVPWVKLILGIICIILSIVWIIHIIIYYLANVHPFLNNFFDILDQGFPYAAVIFFGIFVYYLYWCVLDGASTVGVNLLIIRLYPMEKHNTPMVSILFNTCIMLFASFGIALFCTMNFSIYQRLTSLDFIYGTQIQTLAGLKYVWRWGTVVFLVCIVLGLIWKLVTLKKKDKRIDILNQIFKEHNLNEISVKKKPKKSKAGKSKKEGKKKGGKKKSKKDKEKNINDGVEL